MIPTAEEFYEIMRISGDTECITSNPSPDYSREFYTQIFDLMIEFTKIHIAEALKQASESTEGEYDFKDAYPLYNIK